MSDHDFQKQVHEGYQSVNNQWLQIHFRLLFFSALISGIVECIIFLFILKTDMLNCTISEYLLKYIFAPLFLNFCIVWIGLLLLKRKTLSVIKKQYIISLLFLGIAFVLGFMHSGFVTALAVPIFPILMTTMYENQKLTALTATLAGVIQAISGFTLFWDQKKTLDSSYKINLFVLISVTFFTWLACKYVINFMKMKQKIILQNDLERYRLQRDIDLDGLTRVGNKNALMTRLNTTSDQLADVTYFAMLDLDDFKMVNDTYGHMFGDHVLRCMGEALRSMQKTAEVYRYGGDEFCVVFTEESLESTIQKIESIQSYLTENIKMPDERMQIFVSAGIASYSNGQTINQLLQQADEALYESKKELRNGITVYKNKK